MARFLAPIQTVQIIEPTHRCTKHLKIESRDKNSPTCQTKTNPLDAQNASNHPSETIETNTPEHSRVNPEPGLKGTSKASQESTPKQQIPPKRIWTPSNEAQSRCKHENITKSSETCYIYDRALGTTWILNTHKRSRSTCHQLTRLRNTLLFWSWSCLLSRPSWRWWCCGQWWGRFCTL